MKDSSVQSFIQECKVSTFFVTVLFKKGCLTRFLCPFLISLDRYDVRIKAGSGLFFILFWGSNLNLKNYTSAVNILQRKESCNCCHPEDFTSANCQHSPSNDRDCGSPQKKGKNGDSAGTRNPMAESAFHRKLPAHGREIHQKNDYSARNFRLRDEESSGRMGFCRKLAARRR
jgi:hypothetical protein